MAIVLFGWDDIARRAAEFSVDNPTIVTGLPRTPLNAKREYGLWKPLQEGAFGSIVELDLTRTGELAYIADGSFAFLPNLRVVVLNPKTRSIGASAFKGCTSLQIIGIPSGVTWIGKCAFWDCSSLKSINIPGGVTSISGCVFCGCTSLNSVNIPNEVTSIDEYAFQDCTSLMSVYIPSGVTLILEFAFQGCTGLASINIPSGVGSISRSTFCGCTSLMGISIPSGVTSIGPGAFYGCSLEVVLLGAPELLSLPRLSSARRFVAVWLDDQSSTALPEASVGDAARVNIEGKKVYKVTEGDWRILGRLEKTPLEE